MSLRSRIREWLLHKAIELVSREDQDYADLIEYRKGILSSMSNVLAWTYKGHRIVFSWVECPERGREKKYEEIITSSNPLLERLKQSGALTKIDGGAAIEEFLEEKGK